MEAISTPATAGPRTAGALNATEFKPMALPMYSRGTISGTQLCRAGESNDMAAALAALIRINPMMFIQPSDVNAAKANASRDMIEFVQNSVRRRGNVSATKPATGESSSTGIARPRP